MTTIKIVLAVLFLDILFFTAWHPKKMLAGGAVEEETKLLFNSKCASCHGIDGSANTAIGRELKAKDLRSPQTQKMSDDKLYDVIAKGRDKMPAFEQRLGGDKCRQLVPYIRQLARKQ